MLVVLLLKFLEHWSGFTFISSFSFFFWLNQFLVLINLIDVWLLKLCYRLWYDGRFPVFNYLLGVIELYLWGNFYILCGFLHWFMRDWLLDVKRALVFFPGKFCTWNWGVLALKLTRQTILGISINKTDTNTAVNLDSLILQSVKQDDIVSPQVHINLLRLKINLIFT